jgi:DSF synthase
MIQPTGPFTTSILPSNFASEHVRVEYQEERKTIILTLCPQPRPCVTRAVLDGLQTASQWIRDINTKTPDTIRHMILASDWDGVFSLGGDLDLFVSCIMSGDREQLLTYALDCVRVGHVFHTGFEGTLSTTSVIAGQALGGGLEGAACCQTIIAEKGSVLQLPEIKFGSYLSRRSPGPHVRRMVETGAPLEVEEAYDIRMVDELTPKGHGLLTAHKVNAGLSQAFHGRMATRYALALAQGPSLQELESIARSWVDVAFKIDLRDMRLMNRLASSQLRLSGMQAAVDVKPQPVPAAGVFAFAVAS